MEILIVVRHNIFRHNIFRHLLVSSKEAINLAQCIDVFQLVLLDLVASLQDPPMTALGSCVPSEWITPVLVNIPISLTRLWGPPSHQQVTVAL